MALSFNPGVPFGNSFQVQDTPLPPLIVFPVEKLVVGWNEMSAKVREVEGADVVGLAFPYADKPVTQLFVE